MKLAKQERIHLDLDEVVELNHVTVTFGSLNPVSLHVPLKTLGVCVGTIQCKSPKPKKTQVSCQDTLLHFYFDNESMLYNEGSWTLVTQRRPCKKQESHPYPNLPRKEQCEQNIHRHAKKKEEKKSKRKQAIVHVDDLLVQKLITTITLREYFPSEFFNRGMVTSNHMVSCHEILEEDESSKDKENIFGAEPSKTKEDDEVVANLSVYPHFSVSMKCYNFLRKHELH